MNIFLSGFERDCAVQALVSLLPEHECIKVRAISEFCTWTRLMFF